VFASGGILDSRGFRSSAHPSSSAEPIEYGNRSEFGATISGQTKTLHYAFSARRQDEARVLRFPQLAAATFDAAGIGARDWSVEASGRSLTDLRGEIGVNLTPHLDAALGVTNGVVDLSSRRDSAGVDGTTGRRTFGAASIQAMVSTNLLANRIRLENAFTAYGGRAEPMSRFGQWRGSSLTTRLPESLVAQMMLHSASVGFYIESPASTPDHEAFPFARPLVISLRLNVGF
jgi:hypothetical protein